MNYRELGTTGINVSEIGFGTWAIGGRTPGQTSYGATDDVTSLDALRAALDYGITFFDTANIYGNGHSEELLGQAFTQDRSRVIIASKCGMQDMSGQHDLSPAALRTSVEGSLRRLNSDYIDLLQLHDAPPEVATDEKTIRLFEDLQTEGKIRAIGVSVKSPVHGLQFLHGPWQTVQCNFNMIDQRALECGLILQAAVAGVSVISRTPLAFGFLSGAFLGTDPKFKEGDHRARWSPEQIRLWADAPIHFAPVNEGSNRTMSQLAIKFCISMDGIAATIPGITTPNEARQNASVSDLPPLSKDEIAAIIRTAQEHSFYIK